VGESGVNVVFFFGTFNHNLDDKSRCTLPSKFREKLGTKVYVTKGFDHCLNLYSEETFLKLVEKYATLDELTPEERQYRRMFFSSSSDYEIDKSGRITLSKDHLQRASIVKEVVLVGNNDHIEIWDRDHFNEIDKLQEDNFEANAIKIAASRKKAE